MDPFTAPAQSVVSYGVETSAHGEEFPDLRITTDMSCAVWWTQFGTALKHACAGLMSNDTAMALARVSDHATSPDQGRGSRMATACKHCFAGHRKEQAA